MTAKIIFFRVSSFKFYYFYVFKRITRKKVDFHPFHEANAEIF